MREMGIRELKAHLSGTLHAVGCGEAVRVTFRGTPLVDMVPAGAMTENDRLRHLVSSGRVAPATRSRPDRAPRRRRSQATASALPLAAS